MAFLLFDTALLASGFQHDDHINFGARMFRTMAHSMNLKSLDLVEEIEIDEEEEKEEKEEEKEEEIDLNELLASLEEESVEDESVEEVKSQLSEAMKTVEFLKTQLNEVNLLNAKLLYTNKLFKAHALDNNQKMKIIEAFDLTKSVREVKLTYNNLSEAFNLSKVKTAPKKSTIAEGFASNTTGTTKPVQTEKSVIAESVNGQVSRFQKLAGIKK